MIKPPPCQSCPYASQSTGFCTDHVPLSPVAAFVFRTPSKDDLIFGEPLTGRGGRAWEHKFLSVVGLRRDQVILAHTLRCLPNSGEKFPIGRMRTEAVKFCRRWDEWERQFQPNVWGVTINPGQLLVTPNQEVFLRRAMDRLKGYVDTGYRPVLLMGEEARETYAPWLHGATKKWQNHWWTAERKAT